MREINPAATLGDHPQLVGVLFALVLALSRVSAAAANAGSAVSGP
ncbi:DUF7503 family protein [Halomarina rubra]|uniref:Uncharacterized protein n=1 Tax=Halomarina rubra TaxID=2071873 RepID=A0ABD6ASF8_9EURY|nr:hypothetical protein [Halomarina rubra]